MGELSKQMSVISTIIVLAIGFIGYLVFRALRAPTPGLLGSIAALVIFNFYFFVPPYPEKIVSFICKVAIGIMLGRGVTRASVGVLRGCAASTLFSAAWMIALSLVSGYTLFWQSGMELHTSLLASAAGGISEMSIVALALGANVAVVLFIQLFRFLTVVMVTPFLAKTWANKFGGVKPPEVCAGECENFRARDYAFLMFCALGAAFIGSWLRVPAGDMLGATVGTAGVVLFTGRVPAFSGKIRTCAQIGLGAAIAQNITPDTLLLLGEVFVSLIVPTVVLLTGTFLLCYVLVKFFDFDFVTALLATSPGGLTQMVIMSEELGGDSLRVAAMQLVRLISIISFMPQIIDWLT